MTERRGDTLLFHTPPVIAAQAAAGGKKESEGPLAAGFDELTTDNRLGQCSWEAAEKQLQLRAARLCLQKAGLPAEQVDLALAGDLQAQCTASGYALRELGVPFAGLFGACSTMAEALALGAALCSSGAAQNLLAMTSSHFCAAERQFRTPLSYGAVRTPTAQWTATAAGCCLLRPAGQGVGVAAATLGRVQDYNIKDINNMGAAMAPAAAATLLHYLADTHAELRDFDCIYTGDLGLVGSQMLRELLAAEGLLLKNHADCGCLLYDAGEQRVGAAMAPAAAATLLHYLADTHAELRDFDCIYTGDLGLVGSQMLRELLAAEGLLLKNHADCGCLLYDAGEQRVKSGGSGAGCCAAVLCGHILPKLLRRGSRRVLFIATGALMSQTTFLQKESIPAVAHLVELTAPEKES